MNFSIHIAETLARHLAQMVRKSGKTRNALINEALRSYLEVQRKSVWPKQVLNLAGADKKLKPFEDSRRELAAEAEDPLA